MAYTGQWVQTPKGMRWQHPNGSYTYSSPSGTIKDKGAEQRLRYEPFNFDMLWVRRARDGGKPISPGPANPAWVNRAASRRPPERDPAPAETPVVPPAPELPPPAPELPLATAPVATPEVAPSAAAAIVAKAAPTGAPIAPGAMDLANAGDQLEKLGLGNLRAGRGGGAGVDYKTAFSPEMSGAISKIVGGNGRSYGAAIAPGAFKDMPPIDPQSFTNAPKISGLDGEALAKYGSGSFDAAAAFQGGSTAEDLSARRRAAFLDPNVDSLEGMRRARLVMADEIASRGGDLQKFAADSGQMRALSMKQLEGYLGQLKGGGAPASGGAAAPAAAGAAPADRGPIARPGFDPLQDEWEATQKEEEGYIDDNLAFGGGDDGPAPGMERRDIVTSSTPTKTTIEWRDVDGPTAAKFDAYLRDTVGPQIRANPANANNAVQDYQKFQQELINPDGGAPDPGRLSARAAAGLPPEIGGREELYAAQNALVTGTGVAKPGATVPLPQLSDEALARLRQGMGPAALVTPPSGYGFYNVT